MEEDPWKLVLVQFFSSSLNHSVEIDLFSTDSDILFNFLNSLLKFEMQKIHQNFANGNLNQNGKF